mmetsp:Transcript_1084/g.2872  ORF Transcript_1084/g.2872 Transcript_1084/m.2872 type:complete len:124 (+) Transcript_1084:680-1051(+)
MPFAGGPRVLRADRAARNEGALRKLWPAAGLDRSEEVWAGRTGSRVDEAHGGEARDGEPGDGEALSGSPSQAEAPTTASARSSTVPGWGCSRSCTEVGIGPSRLSTMRSAPSAWKSWSAVEEV